MNVPAPIPLDLVVVADDGAVDLDRAVRRLHEHLCTSGRLGSAGRDWRIVVADTGSSRDRSDVVARLVDELDAVASVPVDGHLDRAGWRAALASSSAELVVFVPVDAVSDLEHLLAPLVQRATISAVGASADDGSYSRRGALAVVGGAGLTAILAACGGSSAAKPTAASTAAATSAPSTSAAAASGSSTSAGGSTVATSLAVEMTQGPYYLDLKEVRRDIREDRKGAALTLDLAVVDTAGAPIKGAVIDIWHCDADGTYSGFVSSSAASNGTGGGGGQGGPPPAGGQGGSPPGGPGGGAATPTDSSTFLRGTQLSDGQGALSFITVYPGWYQGRNVHIHVMVHVGGKVTHTGQFFFDDAFTDTLYASTSPYSARGHRTTRNADDGIYQGGGQASTLVVTKSGDGYVAMASMAVKTA